MTILDGYSFDGLMCAHVADACVRLRLPVRVGPVGIRPVVAGSRVVGRVRPVRHFGSADAFFEAFNAAASGEPPDSASRSLGFANAIGVAHDLIAHNFNDCIREELARQYGLVESQPAPPPSLITQVDAAG